MGRSVSLLVYVALWGFAFALGLLDAVVVVYLRALTSAEMFPLTESLLSLSPRLRSVELTRQLVTPLTLLAPALLLNRSVPVRIAIYMLTSGAWVLAGYACLWLFLRWPGSLLTYDVLFLVARPWVAPVGCVIAVAGLLAAGASLYLFWARTRKPGLPGVIPLAALVSGAALLVLSFSWEGDYYTGGGLPPRFAWGLFATGYLLAVAGTVITLYRFAQQEKARFF